MLLVLQLFCSISLVKSQSPRKSHLETVLKVFQDLKVHKAEDFGWRRFAVV